MGWRSYRNDEPSRLERALGGMQLLAGLALVGFSKTKLSDTIFKQKGHEALRACAGGLIVNGRYRFDGNVYEPLKQPESRLAYLNEVVADYEPKVQHAMDRALEYMNLYRELRSQRLSYAR